MSSPLTKASKRWRLETSKSRFPCRVPIRCARPLRRCTWPGAGPVVTVRLTSVAFEENGETVGW